MELKYNNNKEAMFDCYMYFHNKQTALKTYIRFKKFIILALGLFISLSILFFNWRTIQANDGMTPEDILYTIIPVAISLIIIIVSSLLSGVINKENFEEVFKSNITEDEEAVIKLDDKGITYLVNDNYKFYYWEGVKSIIEENNNIYILLNYDNVIIIPNEAFSEDVEFSKENFINEIGKHL